MDLGAIAEFGGVGATLTVGVGDDVTGTVGEVDDVGRGGVTAAGATFGTECGAGGIGSNAGGGVDGVLNATKDTRVDADDVRIGGGTTDCPGVFDTDGDVHWVPPIPSEMQMMNMAIKWMVRLSMIGGIPWVDGLFLVGWLDSHVVQYGSGAVTGKGDAPLA